MITTASRNAAAFLESVDLTPEQWAEVMRFASALADQGAVDRADARRRRLERERLWEAQQIAPGPDADLALSRLEREL